MDDAFCTRARPAGLLNSRHCVCELGAGVGLSGLVAAKYVAHAILTDRSVNATTAHGSVSCCETDAHTNVARPLCCLFSVCRVPVLLELMSENIQLNHLEATASVHDLDWSIAGARTLMHAYSNDAHAHSKNAPDVTDDSDPSPPRAIWSCSRACVLAADVVYPDTSDAALVALFDTVHTLLGPIDPNDEDAAATASGPESASVDSASPASPGPPLPQLPRTLTGRFICSYFSRDAATTKRMLLAAAAAHFEPTPVDQVAFDPEYDTTSEEDGLQGLVICFRRITPSAGVASTADSLAPAASAASESADALPAWMHLPALKRLWQPAPSRAALALDELTEVNEETAFSGLELGEDSEDEAVK
jgi:hypothetical protein